MSLPVINFPVSMAPISFAKTDNHGTLTPELEHPALLSEAIEEAEKNKKATLPGAAHQKQSLASSKLNSEELFTPNLKHVQNQPAQTESQLGNDEGSESEEIIDCSDSEEELHEKINQSLTKAKVIEILIKEDPDLEASFKKWKEVEKTEINYTKSSNLKIPLNLVTGALIQITSFGAAGFAGKAANQWLVFPAVVTVLNELFSAKAFQMLRMTNVATPDMRKLYDQQRYLGRAVGDLIRNCAGMPTKKKYALERNGKTEKVTAWEMVNIKEYLRAESRNFLVRGLPFLWFSVLNEARDVIIRYDPSSPVAPTLVAGMLAGAITLETGQAIASRLVGAKENPSFSTNYFSHKTAFEKKLLNAMPGFIQKLEDDGFGDESNVKKAEDLKKSLTRDIAYGTMKSSVALTYPAEVKQAFTKRREATSIEPEFPGSRTDTLMSLGGIFISLLLFSYLSDFYKTYESAHKANPNAPHDPLIEATSTFILPLVLIFGGFAFRDSARIIPQVVRGTAKASIEVIDMKMFAPIRAACSAVRQCYRAEDTAVSHVTSAGLPTLLSSTSSNDLPDEESANRRPYKVAQVRSDVNVDGIPLENLIEDPDSDDSSNIV